ncbi:MAG: VIT1/CCC1 transporter family protein [Anaerolineaceae bacterium]|nr:VIT1/CCC1 transporter family protein [Anaerolineaceae bacterium]
MDNSKPGLRIQSFEDEFHHNEKDPHKKEWNLSEIILGGQDGLVNVLGVILGVAAATSDVRVVMVAGLAATFAESISMGAVAYTSTLATADFYESEREREYRHIQNVPNLEKEEVKKIYQAKGFQGNMLNRIVDTITANEDVWVAVMMAEEHKLIPADRSSALKTAIIVGISAIIGSIIPLIPFTFLPIGWSMVASVILTSIVLFIVGAYKAHVTIGKPVRSGFEIALIGTISALAGYVVGALLKVPVTP